jgi:hypothetical protein
MGSPHGLPHPPGKEAHAGQQRKMSSKSPEPGRQMQNRRKHMKIIIMMMRMTRSRRMWASPWRRM